MNRYQAKNFACFPKHSSHFNLCVLVQCFLNSRNEVFFEDYLFCFGMHPCNLSEARERRRWCMGIEMQMERDGSPLLITTVFSVKQVKTSAESVAGVEV